MIPALMGLVSAVNWAILAYFLSLNAVYLALLLLSAWALREHLARLPSAAYDLIYRDPKTPAVSVLMPMKDEAVNAATSVRGALNLVYPDFEVIVIDDGSEDGTLESLRSAFRLVRASRSMPHEIATRPVRAVYRSLDAPNLLVISKENGGKSDALNVGINAARSPFVCAVDGDVILEEDALLRAMRPVVEDPDRVVAVGGIVRVANGCALAGARVLEPRLPAQALPMFQVVEYLRAFLGGRQGLSLLNGLLIISGAFGVFSRRRLLEVGGYRADCVGEDMALVCALHRRLRGLKEDYRIVFVADPVCWTEVPATLESLSRQRRRWQRGLLECLARNRDMLLRPRYGILGLFSFPFFLVFEGLGPLLEFAGLAVFLLTWAAGWVSWPFAAALLASSALLGMLATLLSILLEDLSFRRYPRSADILRMLVYGVLENLAYRPLTAWYRFQGCIDFFRNKKGWGKMERRGLGA